MAEFEGIQTIVNQVVIQAATAVMMALIDADVGPHPATMVSLREPQRQRHDGPALEKPSFNWNAQDRYSILPNFEMDVMNIL